jgi:hypothetical protein
MYLLSLNVKHAIRRLTGILIMMVRRRHVQVVTTGLFQRARLPGILPLHVNVIIAIQP